MNVYSILHAFVISVTDCWVALLLLLSLYCIDLFSCKADSVFIIHLLTYLLKNSRETARPGRSRRRRWCTWTRRRWFRGRRECRQRRRTQARELARSWSTSRRRRRRRSLLLHSSTLTSSSSTRTYKPHSLAQHVRSRESAGHFVPCSVTVGPGHSGISN